MLFYILIDLFSIINSHIEILRSLEAQTTKFFLKHISIYVTRSLWKYMDSNS